MLPTKNDNIYPRNIENIEAVLFHYFSFPISETKKFAHEIFDINQLELNQIEYIAEKVSSNLIFFETQLNTNSLTINSVMSYGIDSLTLSPEQWQGSKTRLSILQDFRNLILNLENDKD